MRLTLLAALITGAGFAAVSYFHPFSEWGVTQSLAPAANESLRTAATGAAGQDSSFPAGEPASLGLALNGETDAGTVVVVNGLPVNAMMSVGEPYGRDGWRLPAAHLEAAVVHPPQDFVGVMDLSVEVRLPDGAIADRRGVRLSWAAQPAEVVASAAPAAVKSQAAAPVMAAANSAPPPALETPSTQMTAPLPAAPAVSAPAAGRRQLDREEIQTLVQRARDLLDARDVIAARLPLERAAQAGDADAAFMLAATYDPEWLRSSGVRGLAADPEKARAWYELASQYGSTAATRRLAGMGR